MFSSEPPPDDFPDSWDEVETTDRPMPPLGPAEPESGEDDEILDEAPDPLEPSEEFEPSGALAGNLKNVGKRYFWTGNELRNG